MTFEKYETGQLFAVSLNDGSWCGCQVIRVSGDFVELVALSGRHESRPGVDQLTKSGPLSREDELATIGVLLAPPPWSFQLVGSADLLVPANTQVRSYGAMTLFERWLYEPWRFFLEPRFAWGMERAEMAEIVLAKRISHVPPRTHWVRLEEVQPGEPFHQDQGVDIRLVQGVNPNWNALDVLEDLHGVTYTGSNTGLIDYLATRPEISSLEWIGPVESLDVSALSLSYLELQIPQLKELRLPPTVRRVTLADTETDLQIHHAANGERLGLVVQSPHEGDMRKVTGVPQLPELTVRSADKVYGQAVASFKALRGVSLQNVSRFMAPAPLASLSELEFVHLLNVLDIETAQVPPLDKWASRPWFELDGLREEDARELQSRLSGATSFYVKNSRTDDWLLEHLDNPFLDWLAEDEARCQQACYTYAEAESQLDDSLSEEAIQDVMKEYVHQFNEMAEETPLTSAQQSSVFDAFVMLLESVGELPGEGWDQRFAAWSNLD